MAERNLPYCIWSQILVYQHRFLTARSLHRTDICWLFFIYRENIYFARRCSPNESSLSWCILKGPRCCTARLLQPLCSAFLKAFLPLKFNLNLSFCNLNLLVFTLSTTEIKRIVLPTFLGNWYSVSFKHLSVLSSKSYFFLKKGQLWTLNITCICIFL